MIRPRPSPCAAANEDGRLSQRVRKRVEQIIGWVKTTAGLARHIGHVRIENAALMAGAAYNLLRMVKLRPT